MTDTPAAPLAPPPPTAADAPMAPEAAKAAIAQLPPEVRKAYTAGDAAAVQHVTKLHEMAYPTQRDEALVIDLSAGRAPAVAPAVAPEPDAASEAPAPVAGDYGRMPFKFAADTPLEHVHEAQRWAGETAAALGLAVPLAHGAVKMLDEAVTARAGKPMDGLELAELDAILDRRWGTEHGAKAALVRAALGRAGAGAERLRQSLLAAGPHAAAWAFESLATHAARAPK